LTPFLRSRGVSRLDLLAITHPDRHVCDGVENLTDMIPVRTCLVPIDSSGKPEYDSLIRDLKRRGTQVVTVGKGDRLPAAGNSLTSDPRSPTPAFNANLLHPAPLHRRFFTDRALSANDLSLVMRFESQRDTLLLCGDLDNPALAAGLPIQANWLRAPHQGSIRANRDLLLDSVRPYDVVVSGWSRLKPAFLDRCAARGIRVHNLRADGALTLDLR
jgi:beta-lactamase superfamily II metal-dependent hydrolase